MSDDKDFNDLCFACRVNQVDKFDYTPLYLASLCGHEEIVRMLLQRGAICDIDKRESIRAVYGALTDQIRNLLISYDISKKVDTNLPFASHFRSLLNGTSLLTEDIAFELSDDSKLRLHRFLLSTRSKYFREKLINSWSTKDLIKLTDHSDINAFSIVVDYLYLHHNPSKFDKIDYNLLLSYGKKIKLNEFIKIIEDLIKAGDDSKAKAKLMNEFQIRMFESARDDFQKLVEDEIINKKIISNKEALTDDQIETFQKSVGFPDIILSVHEENDEDDEENDDKYIFYPVHRAILIRDDYFKVMFSSQFHESTIYELNTTHQIIDRSTTIPTIHLPVSSSEVAEIIIRFFYYDHSEIPLNYAIDVLFAGDLLLNERLKTMAAVTLTTSDSLPDGYDLYDILRAGWETRVDRLEHYVAKTIANNLENYLKDSEFANIVLEVCEKNEFVETLPGYKSYQKDLDEIEDLLQDLQLEA
ncbi:Ankyrin repeat and BTB/POZ domain-containing protein 1 [Wickerhamomyces ciferrii]|uniref:Ankyrin repeat and BTB/POZ domain-containing protein 1 n=1 Tax=Wickerhamomyces ciferrii (strain ATCC 14091 / BCRC 22168 / CBS 111 / JCM 3599 / NBRC 0793 / NRRL Y-1031 F-60-10) TaxID=1206466 RepID=K0K7X6_WICCF|nr:Ankyrin repeat and BTB/POZ domain-containing protein 1 [Wickerhamomyces ciferrii]CCH40920.1 Ankyrin repeat and BTB/POZ domain-containing protein 1 [Wickerhamomyces ciferrii]